MMHARLPDARCAAPPLPNLAPVHAPQGEVSPPAAARALDLVAAVWPPEEEPRPETLLYALMGEYVIGVWWGV